MVNICDDVERSVWCWCPSNTFHLLVLVAHVIGLGTLTVQVGRLRWGRHGERVIRPLRGRWHREWAALISTHTRLCCHRIFSQILLSKWNRNNNRCNLLFFNSTFRQIRVQIKTMRNLMYAFFPRKLKRTKKMIENQIVIVHMQHLLSRKIWRWFLEEWMHVC